MGRILRLLLLLLLLCVGPAPVLAAADPLPSWNDGPARKAIIEFVTAVTDSTGPDYVASARRIAVFDNDGTLWSEKPLYFQMLFAMDRIRELAPQHPEWKERQPFKAVLANDLETVVASGGKGIVKMLRATHGGMTTDAFADLVNHWLETARHPTLDKPYTSLVFQPMLELLAYLRANGFKTFIVSGGGIGFMRPWTQRVYGIPPEQVVGSVMGTRFEIRDGRAVLVREDKVAFVDDGARKPVGIYRFIGRRPIFAFGNSDGDLQMLEYTTVGVEGRRFAGIVHHTDAVREFAYDRDSHVGRLHKALDAARRYGWTVVDMRREWKVIYP
jgi:phosphoserine phosphatase